MLEAESCNSYNNVGKKRIITKQETGDSQRLTGQLKITKHGKKKPLIKGVAHILSSYNNTIVTIADQRGETFVWSSAGTLGFKGARKSTPYAATIVAKDAADKAKKFGLAEISIVVRGIGPGREAAIRGLAGSGLNIQAITDDTPIPHNGVRPPKPRRV